MKLSKKGWNEYPKVKPPQEKYYLVTVDCDYGDFMLDIACYFNGHWYGRLHKGRAIKVIAFHDIPHAFIKDDEK